MVTLKEYEIYLKVKKFIEALGPHSTETEGCDEADLILRFVNGPAYVPLIIESDDKEPTKYYFLSAAARDCGVSKQMIIYAYRNRKTRIIRRKGRFKVFTIEWLVLPHWQSPARQSAVLFDSNLKSQ